VTDDRRLADPAQVPAHDPADLAHAVLLKVAEFLRRLPADQLSDLAEGTAKLELVPKGGRPAPRTRTAAAAPAVPTDRVRTDLAAIADTGAARQYLLDLKLTVPQLKALANELGIALPSKATKDAVVQTIVQWTVGRRLDAEAISRPAPRT
jgi:hypothetical protein